MPVVPIGEFPPRSLHSTKHSHTCPPLPTLRGKQRQSVPWKKNLRLTDVSIGSDKRASESMRCTNTGQFATHFPKKLS